MKYLISFLFLICEFFVVFTTADSWIPSQHECPAWEKKCQPTITKTPNFNADQDAETINVSLQNNNFTNLINIIARRTSEERQQILAAYNTQYRTALPMAFKYKFKGNFRRTLLALLTPVSSFFSDELEMAIQNPSGDRNLAILDILGTLTNSGIATVKEIYLKEHVDNLFGDLLKHLPISEVRTIFFNLQDGRKKEGTIVTPTKCAADVRELVNEISMTFYLRILKQLVLTRNNAHIRAVDYHFTKKMNYSPVNPISTSFPLFSNHDFATILLMMYKIAIDRAEYFAERLNYSLSKWFSIDNNIIRRITVGRSEIDLGNIKTAYLKLYNQTLDDMIEKKIHGDAHTKYRMLLLKLLEVPNHGENN